MRLPHGLLVFLFLALTAGFAIAEEEIFDQSQSIEKIELLGGTIKRDDTLTDRPVIEVNLKGSKKFSYRYLRLLKPFSKMTTLNVSRTEITDSGMLEIGKLTSLTSLYLSKTEISDVGLKELRQLKKLTTLHVVGNNITDDGLKSIGELTELEKLHIGRSAITETGLKELKSLKHLRELNLCHANLNDASVKELSQFTSLTMLLLGNNEMTDAGLVELGNLTNLKLLEFTPKKTTAAGEATLKKSLPSLLISTTKLTGKPMSSLTIPIKGSTLEDLIGR